MRIACKNSPDSESSICMKYNWQITSAKVQAESEPMICGLGVKLSVSFSKTITCSERIDPINTRMSAFPVMILDKGLTTSC